MTDMPMMGMGESEAESAPENEAPMDEESQAAVEAFPELAGDPARIEALKTFVRLCSQKEEEGGYSEEKKPGADLVLAFGAPKKK